MVKMSGTEYKVDYKMKYKCRMCGEEFYNGVTSENIALSTLIQLTTGREIVNNVGMKFLHIKEDHYGIADLIGCEIIRGEKNG